MSESSIKRGATRPSIQVVLGVLSRPFKAERLRETVLVAVALLATVVATYLGTKVQIQLAAFAVALAVALILQTRTRVVTFALILVPISGLIRRLLAGKDAYLAGDPLVLLPYALVGVAIVLSLARPTSHKPARTFVWGSVAAILSTIITVLLRRAFDINGIFFALCLIVPLALALVIGSGKIPPIWPSFESILPGLALAAGAYGLIQFFFLPSWDASWMITTGLQSIGAPYPLQVRVFGASESPGPFALFIGFAMVYTIGRSVLDKSPGQKAVWFTLSGALSVPLLLSGVRSALLAVVLCVAILVVLRGRGLGRILPLALVGVLGYTLSRLIGAVGGQSSILTADRYTNFNVATDQSFLARSTLGSYLSNPLQYVVGNPGAPHVDLLFLDVMVSYGLLAAMGLFALYVGTLIRAIQNLIAKRDEMVSLVAIFVVVLSVTGNAFNSQMGIVLGVVLGSMFLSSTGKSSPFENTKLRLAIGVPPPTVRRRW